MRTALFCLCACLVPASALAQWNRTTGPEGVAISTLATIDGTIYAGTQVEGVYASTDDGLTWTPRNAGIETLEVTTIVGQPGHLFAGTFGGGVFRSVDDGQTWLPPSNAADLAVTAMVAESPYLLAGTIDEGVYRSSDGGETWTQTLPGFTSIQAMCLSGDTILASTYGYTYGSTDGGATWFYVNALEGAGVWSYFCQDSLIVAGAVNQIFKSTDYGNTFTTIDLNFSFGVVNIYSITRTGNTFFMATSYDGIYQSTDEGLTWSPANQGMGPKDARAVVVSESSTLIAGTHYVGVYRSIDLGLSWSKSVTGFPAGSSILTLLTTGPSVYAGTRDGIYRTDDHGDSWTKLSAAGNDTINYSTVRGLCEKDGTIFAGTFLQFHSTVYKSTDKGVTWTPSGSGLPPNLTFVSDMVTSGDNLIASTDEGIYYSPDDGDHWYPSNIPDVHIPSVAAGNGFVIAADPGGGIWRSLNDGMSWTLVLPSTVDYVEVAAIDHHGFAGSFFSGGRYSTNSGGTWFTSSGLPPETSIFALGPVGDGMVLAGTDLGPSWIYASFDDGASYSPYSEGLGERAPVEAFAVNDLFMFAGTDYNGVWRRLRPGTTGVQADLAIAPGVTLFDNYPNPFNPLTTIRYDLPVQARVSLKIYDVAGREIRTLVDRVQPAGLQSAIWNGRDHRDRPVSSGVYVYRLQAGDQVRSREMILLK
jgi:photosystem II stability/assembly factor-like uncharacterized protein